MQIIEHDYSGIISNSNLIRGIHKHNFPTACFPDRTENFSRIHIVLYILTKFVSVNPSIFEAVSKNQIPLIVEIESSHRALAISAYSVYFQRRSRNAVINMDLALSIAYKGLFVL